MKREEPVSKIMTKDIVSITSNDSLDVAEHLFKKHHIRHIPVVQDKKILGMLSLTDLLRISFADEVDDEDHVETIVYNMFTIDQVMTKHVVCVSPDNTIKEVAEILASREFHALPVVSHGQLVGIVTTTDLINFLLRQYDEA